MKACKYLMNFDIALVSKKRTSFLTCIAITICITFVYYSSITRIFISMQSVLIDSNDDSFFVKTPGCRISKLDPFDASIRKFLYGRDIECHNTDKLGGPLLVKSKEKSLVVEELALSYYNVSIKDLLGASPRFFCLYQPFERIKPDPNVSLRNIDDKIMYGNLSEPFTNLTLVWPPSEFIRVMCYLNKTQIYEDFLFFPSNNPVQKDNITDSQLRLNTYIFSIDAVSRLNLIREMPSFYSYIINDLKGFDMAGYHKVGDNTFPNLIPLTTGETEDEIKKTCWPRKDSFFDPCNFIWKEYKKTGFITGFIEDEPSISGFNYLKSGFEYQPTDFYLRPLYLEANKYLSHSANHVSNTKLCMGKRLNVEFFLDIVFKFIVHLKDLSKFGFFWETSLTHDFSNFPRLGDKIHTNFLKKLNSLRIFDNSFMLFLSDHGLRWGGIRNTYQGRIEERMPFLLIVPPKWFEPKFPLAFKNLKKNTKRLITPFDVHKTILDLLDLSKLNDRYILEQDFKSSNNKTLARAFSLFTLVSHDRTCKDAAIPYDYCACHDKIVTLSVHDVFVQKAAKVILTHINKMLANYTECSTLLLQSIKAAKVEYSSVSGSFESEESTLMFYSIVIETIPGNALFEATLVYRPHQQTLDVIGTVSRTNLYKGQSECVQDNKLRLYCFCV